MLDQHQQARGKGAVLVLADQGNQHQGQENSHRVVAARFDFQGGADPFVKVQPPALKQGENRSGIGGGDNGADQQGDQPVQVEHPPGNDCRSARRQGDTHGGQHHGGFQANPEGIHAGTHTAVEQDNAQSQVGDQEGEFHIIELDTPGPVLAHQHAYHQEDQ